MSEQFVGAGNKKPRDRHRLKVGRGFLRGLHKDIAFKDGTCKQIFQISFAEQFRMNDSMPIVNTVPAKTMQRVVCALRLEHGVIRKPLYAASVPGSNPQKQCSRCSHSAFQN